MKLKTKKLVLSRETLRSLSTTDLTFAQGAYQNLPTRVSCYGTCGVSCGTTCTPTVCISCYNTDCCLMVP